MPRYLIVEEAQEYTGLKLNRNKILSKFIVMQDYSSLLWDL